MAEENQQLSFPDSGSTTRIRIVGAKREPFRDLYFQFLRMSWPRALGAIVVAFLLLNVGFAAVYLVTGGVANLRPGSFADAFFFSVQTLATIGYGAMYPVATAAHLVVVVEAVTGLLVTAVATGLVFAKFSVARPRVIFSDKIAIGPMDGVPTLMVRLSNERTSQIAEAHIRMTLVRTERTREGVTFYRQLDLPPTRDRSQALSRSWTVTHPIVAGSPLYGATPESMAKDEIEIIVSVAGTDDLSLQPVHARWTYDGVRDVVFGARHADIIREHPDGSLTLDLRRFHLLEPTEPIPGFAFPVSEPVAEPTP